MDTWKLFVLLLTGVLWGACSDREEPVREPLETPAGVVFSRVQQTTLTVSWNAVPHAGAYAFRLLRFSAGDAVTLVRAQNEFYPNHITFTGLTPDSRYSFELRARAFQDSPYSDSDTKKSEIFTAPEVAAPWVEVAFSYTEQGGKGTLQFVNYPNSKCEHFYSTTADAKIVGDGFDESSFVAELISDHAAGRPGVYRDSKEHAFNDNGAGFEAGDRLFYGVAGVDKNGKPGDLDWYWLEIPAAPGDRVIILDCAVE